MEHVKTLGSAPSYFYIWRTAHPRRIELNWGSLTSVVAGVLDDGLPALRMYTRQGDRAGVSIPTTANSKAIIKQVKRALQVGLDE